MLIEACVSHFCRREGKLKEKSCQAKKKRIYKFMRFVEWSVKIEGMQINVYQER